MVSNKTEHPSEGGVGILGLSGMQNANFRGWKLPLELTGINWNKQK